VRVGCGAAGVGAEGGELVFGGVFWGMGWDSLVAGAEEVAEGVVDVVDVGKLAV
jgi:hypothetical protein